MKLLNSEILEILEDGQLQRLTYGGLLAFHRSNAMWGASVGYRAMQRRDGLCLMSNYGIDRTGKRLPTFSILIN